MRVAFLFRETFPNYDIDLQLFSFLTPAQLSDLETYVRCGLWGLTSPLWLSRAEITLDDLEKRAAGVFITGRGNVWSLQVDSMTDLIKENVYTVLLDSIDRDTVYHLHNRLSKTDRYLGFTQVISHLHKLHGQTFTFLIPRYRVEGGTIYVLFSSSEEGSEAVADEIIEWYADNFRGLTVNSIHGKVEKVDISLKFTVLDEMTDPENELAMFRALYVFEDLWEVSAEHILYKLRDVSPTACEEIVTGILSIDQSMSPPVCAQISVNFRRAMEMLADSITPPLTEKERREARLQRKGEYKYRLSKYIKENLSGAKHYQAYLDSELEELSTRMEKLYNLGNKGVHEDWICPAIRMIALRLVLLIGDLLYPVSFKQRRVLIDTDNLL